MIRLYFFTMLSDVYPQSPAPQVSIVEKADSSSVLPCPVSISTKNKMNFLFANLKDRDFLVQRISDFLQRTPDSSWGDTSPLSLIGHSVRHSCRVSDWLQPKLLLKNRVWILSQVTNHLLKSKGVCLCCHHVSERCKCGQLGSRSYVTMTSPFQLLNVGYRQF